MFALLVLTLLVIGQDPTVESMSVDRDMASEHVTADYLTAPSDVSLDKFASDLALAEGLTQWDNGPPMTMVAPSGYRLINIVSGDGRAVTVTWRPEVDQTHVCRIRAAFNGAGRASYRAGRWCGNRFGIELPEQPSPSIVSGPVPQAPDEHP